MEEKEKLYVSEGKTRRIINMALERLGYLSDNSCAKLITTRADSYYGYRVRYYEDYSCPVKWQDVHSVIFDVKDKDKVIEDLCREIKIPYLNENGEKVQFEDYLFSTKLVLDASAAEGKKQFDTNDLRIQFLDSSEDKE